ncbi:hypothetical protein DXU93_13285 [Brumimicrobium aurantiacum]|uniref:Uncharacterized protein n=2 Tax=Brumimicrobium aurantiacum TaxID=1737063 RepID=A0A3E1EV12_9FLAO|nr:hypothetical protein DXU93_13285 [Brumimicrobium aurantiacum]
MKSFILFVFILFVLGCQKKEEYCSYESYSEIGSNLEQKIKSITQVSFITKKFSPDSMVFNDKTIRYYDTLGKLIERQYFIIDSTQIFEHSYQIKKGDTLLKIDQQRSNFYTPKITIDTATYINGKLIEEVKNSLTRYTHTVDGEETEVQIPVRTMYHYNDQNQLISTDQKKEKNIYHCDYIYDSLGLLIEKNCSDEQNELNHYTEQKLYNANGLKIKQFERSYQKDSIVAEYKRFYNYNSKDSLIAQSWYRNGKNFLIYNYEYNDKNQKIAEYAYNDSSGDSTFLALQTFFYYDENDLLKMKSILGQDNSPIQINLYNYDSHGNKTEESRFTYSIDKERNKNVNKLMTRYRYEIYP